MGEHRYTIKSSRWDSLVQIIVVSAVIGTTVYFAWQAALSLSALHALQRQALANQEKIDQAVMEGDRLAAEMAKALQNLGIECGHPKHRVLTCTLRVPKIRATLPATSEPSGTSTAPSQAPKPQPSPSPSPSRTRSPCPPGKVPCHPKNEPIAIHLRRRHHA